MNDFSRLQLLFQSLSDANRLRILKLIGTDERSVSELVQSTDLSQPLVSHHLKALRDKGILETSRKGPFIYHRLKEPRLLEAIGIFLEIADTLNDTINDRPVFQCPPLWRGMRYKR